MSKAHNCLYYLAKNDKEYEQIMKEGIIPTEKCIADISMDKEKITLLCEFNQVGKWKILEQKPIVLRISNVAKEDCKEVELVDIAKRLIYDRVISPENIERAYVFTTRKQMKELCVAYAIGLSIIISNTIYHYDNNTPEHEKFVEYISKSTNNIVSTIDRLDYKNNWRWVAKKLREYADEGNYTFLDTYCNSDIKLYEQITMFPRDDTYGDRWVLRKCIQTAFKNMLNLDTGGYTKC